MIVQFQRGRSVSVTPCPNNIHQPGTPGQFHQPRMRLSHVLHPDLKFVLKVRQLCANTALVSATRPPISSRLHPPSKDRNMDPMVKQEPTRCASRYFRNFIFRRLPSRKRTTKSSLLRQFRDLRASRSSNSAPLNVRIVGKVACQTSSGRGKSSAILQPRDAVIPVH